MLQFGMDDDSIMRRLANELDMQSAEDRLRRVGFRRVKHHPAAQQQHLFHRAKEDGVEMLSITLDNNRFIIAWAYDDAKTEYMDIISSWDQWIDFVRLLVMRSSLRTHQKELPDHN